MTHSIFFGQFLISDREDLLGILLLFSEDFEDKVDQRRTELSR